MQMVREGAPQTRSRQGSLPPKRWTSARSVSPRARALPGSPATGQERMQQTQVRGTACTQNLRIEVAKVQALAATAPGACRHGQKVRVTETCTGGHFQRTTPTDLARGGALPADDTGEGAGGPPIRCLTPFARPVGGHVAAAFARTSREDAAFRDPRENGGHDEVGKTRIGGRRGYRRG